MSTALAERGVLSIPMNQIIISPLNPRVYCDDEKLKELADSEGEIGQIYPVIVRPINNSKYELIIGSRRFKSAQKRHLQEIPAIVIEESVKDDQVLIISLCENLHQQDLMPFEEARAILRLCKDFKMSPGTVAKKIGKSTDFVMKRLKILSVPEKVQEMFFSGEVGITHIGIIASLPNARDQIRYAKAVTQHKLSEQDLSTLVRSNAELTGKKKPRNPKRLPSVKSVVMKVAHFKGFLIRKFRPHLATATSAEKNELRSVLVDLRQDINKLLKEIK